jgi:hypothetical protein
MAEELAWDDAQTDAEVQRYRKLTGAGEVPAPHILAPNGQADGHSVNGASASATMSSR